MSKQRAVNDLSDCDEPKAKKAQLDDEILEKETVHGTLKDLSNFEAQKLLSNNSCRKTVCLQGKFTDRDGVAVVFLEKSAFLDDDVLSTKKDSFFGNGSALIKHFHNDIYGDYEFLPKPEFNSIKTTIIHPATEKHIEKYSSHNIYIVNETWETYSNIILPHLLNEQFKLDWVYNILEHKSEVDRIVFEDQDLNTGFILLPDLKWDIKNPDTLYLLAIVHKKHLKSLRDLNAEHLPLLKNIRDKGTATIEEKFGLKPSQLRIYLHYRPSFYHLHVHFVNLKHEAPGIFAERSHLLSTVIGNIELLPDYYQRAVIPFAVKENESLFEKLFDQKGDRKKNSEF